MKDPRQKLKQSNLPKFKKISHIMDESPHLSRLQKKLDRRKRERNKYKKVHIKGQETL